MLETIPPIATKFRLGPITEEQERFLDRYGFLHFEAVIDADEVAEIKNELADIERRWIEEDRRSINGIPIFYGRRSDGRKCVQRFAFASLFSSTLSGIIRDIRFNPLLALINNARLSETEKDGVVVNRFINEKGSICKRLGWHTDGLRDLFYLQMPKRMLNVGLHLDDVTEADGGLRLIPGSHLQGFFSMCFRKLYFVWHRPDPAEVCIETKAGDLTVHDGRLWHRVAQSQKTGQESQRNSIYVPYLTGPVEPKGVNSATPFYHRLGVVMRAIKRVFVGISLVLGLSSSALAGEEAEEGAMSGTFAFKLANADWVKIPILGRKMNRARSWFLVHREWSPAEQVYRQQSRLCRVTNDVILGTVIELDTAAVEALPATSEWVTVNPNSGHFRMDGHVQMWGIQNLPSAQDSPLPETVTEANTDPFSQQIYDMDGDGLPGVTMWVRGIVHGRMLGIQRKRVSLTGRVVDSDHTMGTSVVSKENFILQSSNPFAHVGQLQRSVPVVDPAENWFEEIRLQHDAGCQDVLALEETAAFSKAAPL